MYYDVYANLDKDIIYRQEAIDALADYIHDVDKVYSTGKLSMNDCKDAAYSVLGELPSAQPEIKCIANITLTDEQVKEAFEKARCNILSAQPKWIESGANYECPFCHNEFDYISTRMGNRWCFCPNCGADMRGEKDEAD